MRQIALVEEAADERLSEVILERACEMSDSLTFSGFWSENCTTSASIERAMGNKKLVR